VRRNLGIGNRGNTGTDGTFTSFSGELSNRDEAGLSAIGGWFLGAPALSRSERTGGEFFQPGYEIRTPQRSPGVGRVPQGADVGGRFRVADEPPPLSRRPSLPPAFYIQQGVWGGQATVRRGARPFPPFRRRHHAGAHWIQLHVAQCRGLAQLMYFVQSTTSWMPHPWQVHGWAAMPMGSGDFAGM